VQVHLALFPVFTLTIVFWQRVRDQQCMFPLHFAVASDVDLLFCSFLGFDYQQGGVSASSPCTELIFPY
jgi:hypothetical protein